MVIELATAQFQSSGGRLRFQKHLFGRLLKNEILTAQPHRNSTTSRELERKWLLDEALLAQLSRSNIAVKIAVIGADDQAGGQDLLMLALDVAMLLLETASSLSKHDYRRHHNSALACSEDPWTLPPG